MFAADLHTVKESPQRRLILQFDRLAAVEPVEPGTQLSLKLAEVRVPVPKQLQRFQDHLILAAIPAGGELLLH